MTTVAVKLKIDPASLYRQRLLLCYLAANAPERERKYLDGMQDIFDDIADQYYEATGDESVFLDGTKKEDRRGKKQLRRLVDALQHSIEQDDT
jgi:hypothetical protein